jgi:hypothetical protein
LPIPHPFLFLSFPSSSISLSSILSPFHLHLVFLPVPFSPSLSFLYIHSQLSLSPHSTFCTFFLSFHPIPVFFLLVLTSKSRHHSSFFSPQVLRNFLRHTSIILPVVFGFFDSFASSLFVVPLSLSLNSTFIHLPFALNLSTFSLAYPFLWYYFSLSFFSVFFFFSPQHSISILHSSLLSILSSNLPLSFLLSL